MWPLAPALFSTTTCWPQAWRQRLGDDAAEDVGDAGRGERHDQAHRLGREGLGARAAGAASAAPAAVTRWQTRVRRFMR
jgi:hypothetical protein